MNDAITPFTRRPAGGPRELNRRIYQTRWPDAETVDDWTQGAPLAKVKALVDHWRHRYDWRRCEAMLIHFD
jgi:epoxide hydrolase